MINRSNDNIRVIRGAYEAGAFKITDLLSEQRRLVDSQRELTDTLSEQYRALKMVRYNRWLQAFLAGASVAAVGLIIVVSLDLIPAALLDFPTIAVALVAFLVITVMKVDVAR